MENSPKKIGLFFTQGVSLAAWQKAGFLERELKYYCALTQKGLEVTFFTYGTVDQEGVVIPAKAGIQQNGFRTKYGMTDEYEFQIIVRPRWCPSFLYSVLMPLVRARELRKTDVFKTNQMRGSWTAVLAKLLFGKKLAVRCGYEWLSFVRKQKRNILKRAFVYLVEWFAYHCADAILLTSEKDKKFIGSVFGKKIEGKVSVVPNYIDTDLFAPTGEHHREGVVYVGRFSEEKNLFNLIRALEGTDIPLTLIGDGPQKEELVALAQKLGVRASFPGKISNERLPEELGKHAAFVLCSLYEGNPKALLEAMSCGLACLGTNVEGIQDVISHGKTGLLCGASSEELQRGLRRMFESAEFRATLGNEARKSILTHNSLPAILEKEMGIYGRI